MGAHIALSVVSIITLISYLIYATMAMEKVKRILVLVKDR